MLRSVGRPSSSHAKEPERTLMAADGGCTAGSRSACCISSSCHHKCTHVSRNSGHQVSLYPLISTCFLSAGYLAEGRTYCSARPAVVYSCCSTVKRVDLCAFFLSMAQLPRLRRTCIHCRTTQLDHRRQSLYNTHGRTLKARSCTPQETVKRGKSYKGRGKPQQIPGYVSVPLCPARAKQSGWGRP
jgi:hypothetical protein